MVQENEIYIRELMYLFMDLRLEDILHRFIYYYMYYMKMKYGNNVEGVIRWG